MSLFNQKAKTGSLTKPWEIRLYHTGVTWSTEIESKASPRTPSNPAARKAMPGSPVISANCWSLTVVPAIPKLSALTKPEAAPEPYWIANLVPLACTKSESFTSNYIQHRSYSWCGRTWRGGRRPKHTKGTSWKEPNGE